MGEPTVVWPCGPVPEGRRWLTPMECHGNGAYCSRCSPRNPKRATIITATDYVRCSRCGARCSNDVPAELVVRAFVECPECVAAQPEPEVHVTLTKGGVVTVDGFGRVLDPGDTYTTSAPADLTIQ